MISNRTMSMRMFGRSHLVACAIGCAAVNAVLIATRVFEPSPAMPDVVASYRLPAVARNHDAAVERLIECGATRFWFSDEVTHSDGFWVLEANRANANVARCYRARARYGLTNR